ncbi:hypothetical protein PLESTF_000105800 [Pleodorina starrii]|nr:hypothetical protein PLESTM_001271600 [Pleodorina starrii]GLC63984.1 hypothetical protein PLESTF_000105800 [Pleodorina starrii]
MVLLRRRNWILTLVAACATLLSYQIGVVWLRPAFMEEHYYGKQRLWAEFLATCDCDEKTCPDTFKLSMMHGSLYDRLMLDSRQGNRSVVKHLVWQPYKVAAAYPWRLRMYAHMALVLPRSLALMHGWWLSASEDLALALHHLSRGVPLVLDPDSAAGQRVEPDASILCKLEPPDAKEGPEAQPQPEPEEHSRAAPAEPSGNGTAAEQPQPQQQQQQPQEQQEEESRVQKDPEDRGGDDDGGGGSGEGGPGGNRGDSSSGGSGGGGGSDATAKSGGGGGGGGKRKRKAAAPDDEASVRRFVCTLYDVRGGAAMLRLLSPDQLAAAASGRRRDSGGGRRQDDERPLPPLPAPVTPPPPPPLPAVQGALDVGGDSGSGGTGDGQRQEMCIGPNGEGAVGGSCPAPAEWAAAPGAAAACDAAAAEAAESGIGAGGGDGTPGQDGPAAPPPVDAGSKGPEGGPRGDERAGGGDDAGGGVSGACRNSIFIRPPRQSEVSEHVRETEASPLGLSFRELVRTSLPRVAEALGWLLLPHVMLGRYVLLLAPFTAAGAAGDGAGAAAAGAAGGGYGSKSYNDQPPMSSVGVQLMLLAGTLLTTVELLLWARVASELMSLSRPRRPWARRREAAWRVVYEGMVQPLREALLSWNITHFVGLPLLQLALSMPSLDWALLLPLAYCVLTLGTANCDVAARATPALLRVARRARHHEGGYHLLLLNVVMSAEPQALPYITRLLQWVGVFEAVGNAGRAAVVAATLEEAPGLAAALAAAAQRRGGAAAAAGGAGADGGGGGDLAAAMMARVAAAEDPDREGRHGRADGELYDSDDDIEEEEAEDGGRDVRAVVLRWPAPLKLPPEVHDWEDVPRGFTCAITQQLMTQPAMLVSPELPAAPTYERSAIQQWLAGQMRDPKSNTALRSYNLLPNEDLYRAIDDWVTHRLRDAQRPPRRSGRTRRRPTGRHDPGGAGGAAAAAAVALPPGGPGAGQPPTAAVAVVGMAALDADADGGPSASHSGDDSDSYTRSAGRSASVLASLAQGASDLMDTGMEVMSRAAAAAAATAVAAAAAAGGGLARREQPPRPDAAGPDGAAPGGEEQQGGRGGPPLGKGDGRR